MAIVFYEENDRQWTTWFRLILELAVDGNIKPW